MTLILFENKFPAAMAPKPIRRVAADGIFEKFHIFLGDGILVPFGGIVRNHLHIHTIVAHTLLDHLIVEHGDIVLAGEMLRPEDYACGLVQELCDITTFPAVGRLVAEHHIGHENECGRAGGSGGICRDGGALASAGRRDVRDSPACRPRAEDGHAGPSRRRVDGTGQAAA